MNKVKGFRVMVNMTQEDMASSIKMPLRTYVNKETGKTDFTIDELQSVKEVLNKNGLTIKLDDLV